MANSEKTIYVEIIRRQKSNNEGQTDQKDKRQNSQSTKTKDKQECTEWILDKGDKDTSKESAKIGRRH